MKSIFLFRIIVKKDILMDDKCKVWEILKFRMYKKNNLFKKFK